MFLNFEYLKGDGPGELCPIEKALVRQEFWFEERLRGNNYPYSHHHILFAEHPHIYTYVPSKAQRQKLFRDEKRGEDSLPADLVAVDRSCGSITYHGPGQLVCYFIVSLQELGVSVLQLGALADDILIDLLKNFGIQSRPKPPHIPKEASGVWITTKSGLSRKIAARGFHLRRGITRFGFALNVSTDLSYFDYIYPCGCDIQMTSMKKILGDAPPIKEVADCLKDIVTKRLSE